MSHGRLSWFQFRLRTLALLITLSAVISLPLGIKWRSHENEARIASALAQRGVGVYFEKRVPGWLGTIPLVRSWNIWDSIIGIDCTRSRATVTDLQDIKQLDCLKWLSLTGLPVTDDNLKTLHTLKSLEILFLCRCPVTDAGLTHLRSFSKLQNLWLNGTLIEGPGISHLEELPRLASLFLECENLRDCAFVHLSKCSMLTQLTVSSPHITDDGLCHLAKLDAIESLTVCGDRLTDKGLERLARHSHLSKLQILHAAGDNVTCGGKTRLRELRPGLNTGSRAAD